MFLRSKHKLFNSDMRHEKKKKKKKKTKVQEADSRNSSDEAKAGVENMKYIKPKPKSTKKKNKKT